MFPVTLDPWHMREKERGGREEGRQRRSRAEVNDGALARQAPARPVRHAKREIERDGAKE